MNRTELVAAIAEKTGVSQKDTKKILEAFLNVVQEELVEGNKVQLIGFGTFETRKREARMGKNPLTGEAMEIKASVVPVFKAGKAFKQAVHKD